MKYFSEKLNKMFDSEKELISAEKALAEAEKEKADKALLKKADAQKVEAAFKTRCEAHRAAAKMIDEADKSFDTALEEFKKKYPEGYHMTLKDGDDSFVVSYSNLIEDPWSTLFKSFFRF